MRYDSDENRIYISVDELSFYAYQRENPELLCEKFGFIKNVVTSSEKAVPDYSLTEEERFSSALQSIAESYADLIDSTHIELPLSKETVVGGYSVTVEGLSDIISYDGVLHTVEVIRSVRRFSRELSPFSYPETFARAAVLAYIFADGSGISEIKLKITFVARANGERASFTALFSKVALSRMFDTLLCRMHPFIEVFAERYTVLNDEIADMPFPYSSIREGQEQFIKEAYRAIKHGEDLLVSAPTGIGKTMSAIFPAVKSVGAGASDRIFYLTAKTITGRAALDAAELLTKHVPHMRACMILSKEMTCPLKRRFDAPGMSSGCFTCELTNAVTRDYGKTSVSYREREVLALTALLKADTRIYTPELIKKTAEEFSVCPYELSLDISEQCQLIVCDCNYVIDDNVRFRRYFKKEGNNERYVFLFDEAHNLPDRTRNTYSASINLGTANALLSAVHESLPETGKLYDSCVELVDSLKEIRELCRDGEYVKQTESGEISCGYFEDSRVLDAFAKSVGSTMKLLAAAIRDPDTALLLRDYYAKLYKLASVIPNFDEKFRLLASKEGEDVNLELLCIDPSGVLGRMLAAASSVIMFSATLSPMDYFAEVMGLKDAGCLELSSPYEKENLCLVTYDSVSTRFSDRKATADDCAEVIVQTVSAREGNYIVYFPSYEYMKRVCRSFSQLMPDVGIVMQKPGMSYRERQRFIEIFHEHKMPTIVGFCVLGGMFSEGIDLAGESLIGAVIVGCGMPQLSAERNIMSAYYDEKTERGHEFAYVCPGMNKVLQAAGRVIRSETDRGVIVLIDDRLNDPNMKLLFPPHWRHMKYTSNLTSLDVILGEFWGQNDL